jgi:hypothetical protein
MGTRQQKKHGRLACTCACARPKLCTGYHKRQQIQSGFKGLWRNGSASDSRSEGWEFESLWPHFPVQSQDDADMNAVEQHLCDSPLVSFWMQAGPVA